MATLSRRVRETHASETMQLTELALRLRNEGRDIINLVGGEPDYDTAEAVKTAGILAIERNITRYPPGAGFHSLREAISSCLRKEKGMDIPPDGILVSCGTKPLLQAALLACADPGDEVIIPSPHWISYPQLARLSGLSPVLLPCSAENGFRMTAEQLRAAIGVRTRAIILNSPNNPTGAVYDRYHLEAIGEVLRERPDIWIITDEIYDMICYAPDPVVPFAAINRSIADRTITINGFSKAYAMAGWRLGYAAASTEIIAAMTDVINHVTGPTSSISQLAGLEAIAGDRTYLAVHREEYRQRRDIVVTAINRMPGLSCQPPEGAFFAWGNCAGVLGKVTADGVLIESEQDFVAAAARAGVMFMPGAAFGMSPYFRISYSVSPDLLHEAMRRLTALVDSLQPCDRD